MLEIRGLGGIFVVYRELLIDKVNDEILTSKKDELVFEVMSNGGKIYNHDCIVHDVNVAVDTINYSLHNFYRLVTGSNGVLQPCIYIFDFQVRCAEKHIINYSNLSNALQLIANNNYMPLIQLNVETDILLELRSLLALYPKAMGRIFGVHPFSANEDLNWTNLLRYSALVLLTKCSKFDYNGIIYILGARAVIIQFATLLSIKYCVVDMKPRYTNIYLKLLYDVHNIASDEISYSKAGYEPPMDDNKLLWLDVIALSYSSHLLVIGAAPGQHYLQFNKLPENRKIILIDPRFKLKNIYSHNAIKLKDLGFEVMPVLWDFSVTRSKLRFQHEWFIVKPLISIVDDTYCSKKRLTSKDKMDFLTLKVKYFINLIDYRLELGLHTHVFIKFNPLDTLYVGDYFYDIYPQPSANATTEMRLHLSSYKRGASYTILYNERARVMNYWRDLSGKEKYDILLSTVSEDAYIVGDYSQIRFHDKIVGFHALFTLTNVLDNVSFSQNIRTLKHVIQGCETHGIPIILNTFRAHSIDDMVDVNGIRYQKQKGDGYVTLEVLSSSNKERRFKDYVYDYKMLFDLNMYDIRDTTIISIGNTYGYGTIAFSYFSDLVQFWVNGLVVNDLMVPQSGYTSPGCILKKFTARYRFTELVPRSTLYHKRLEFVHVTTNIEQLDIAEYASSQVTFRSNIDQMLNFNSNSIFSGLSVPLSKNVDYAISGHILNLLISYMYEPSQLMLWIKQWVYQQKALDHKKEYYHLLSQNLLFDYNAERNLFDNWHNVVDVLLALSIAHMYIPVFKELTKDELRSLKGIIKALSVEVIKVANVDV